MGTLKLGNKTLATQTGTDNPVLTSNVSYSGAITSSATFPAGHIIQVKHFVYDTVESYSISQSTFGAYSNVQLAITPTYNTSKIFGIINLDGVTWTSDSTYGHFYLYRDSTHIQYFGYPRQWSSSDNSSGVTMTCHFYDSPGVDTEITYKFRFYSHSGTSAFNINRDGASYSDSNITLFEVSQ